MVLIRCHARLQNAHSTYNVIFPICFSKGYPIYSIGCSSRVLRSVKEALTEIRSKFRFLLDESFGNAFYVESMKVLHIVILHHHHRNSFPGYQTIFRLGTPHLIMLDRYLYEIFIQPFPAPQAKNGYFVYLSTSQNSRFNILLHSFHIFLEHFLFFLFASATKLNNVSGANKITRKE